MIIVNGNTWPFQTVEQRRYRFRVLNGCQSRFLILDFSQIPGVEVWEIGNEGGFLAAPVNLTASNGNRLLMGLAERADLIVDFTDVPVGNHVLGNVGPDEPFGGGVPGVDFPAADPTTTGQIMQFRVVPAVGVDTSHPATVPPAPARSRHYRPATLTRPTRPARRDVDVLRRRPHRGPARHRGRRPQQRPRGMDRAGCGWTPSPRTRRSAPPRCGSSTTPPPTPTRCTSTRSPSRWSTAKTSVVDEDSHTVQVAPGTVPKPPQPWETGVKDTVIAYPGQVTRVRAQFNNPGQFVWHCHIVEHEDNEMMRPYRIGPPQPGQPD